MRFRLARQVNSDELNRFLLKEIRRQSPFTSKLTRGNLVELKRVCGEIEGVGLPARFVRKKLPKKLGSGIFLHPKAKPILRGQVIVPYSGKVVLEPQNEPDDSCYAFAPLTNLRLNRDEQKMFHPEGSFRPKRLYLISVDAWKKGNFSRFINHSSEPNVVAHLVKVPKNRLGLSTGPLEVIYFAKKTIRPGEQLLVSYEDGDESYWGPMGIKPFPMGPKTFQVDSSIKLVNKLN
jgi:hypothetical protein